MVPSFQVSGRRLCMTCTSIKAKKHASIPGKMAGRDPQVLSEMPADARLVGNGKQVPQNVTDLLSGSWQLLLLLAVP